ncbi:hypothetical protein CKK33_06590 [Mucilaginibacter sp. MD40]|uniref:DUF6443 domain-containing protein n=1 Tax=Mucilaginibacter sp. MD40 TaxID=2029590 RepID=UPI000BACE971|nr:DUF6443 domain-containing protein [Mucilaginibacter sp. MD40]PAW93179.1 hypothetical protein CKK33_06590 [Mucilaginibacter sp. MD40]
MKIRLNKMRKLLISACFVVISTSVYSQVQLSSANTSGTYTAPLSITLLPGFSTAAGQTFSALIIPGLNCAPLTVQPSVNRNFVMEYTARDSNITNPDATTLTNCAMLRTVQYFDGLGRPLQTVQIRGSKNGDQDVVQPMLYDQYGRQPLQYLPYVTASSAAGAFHIEALNPQGNYNTSGQKQFYLPVTGQNYKDMTTPYAASVYEASPLNRLTQQGAPGDAWQPGNRTATSGRTVISEWDVNNADPITTIATTRYAALWKATVTSTQAISLSRASGTAGVYDAGQLTVSIIKDENWLSGRLNSVEEFKDKEGRVVLKRTFVDNSGTTKALSTYYVYDDRGLLAFVLPPKADADNATSLNQTQLDEWCYQYRYDERGRITQKKLPGKGWEFFIYNRLNQVIATQDAVQRSKAPQEWTVTKYDALARVAMLAIWQHPSSTTDVDYRASLQTQATGTAAQWETPVNTGTGYTALSWPATTSITPLQINYYDNYTQIPGGIPAGYAPASYITLVNGKLTSTKTNVLGTSVMLQSVIYYDDMGRVTNTYSQHYYNGTTSVNNYDEIRTGYAFSGDVQKTVRTHYINGSGNVKQTGVVVTNTYTYDHIGRKLDTKQRTGSPTSTEVLIARNEYNDIGQLYKKYVHSENDGSTFLQTTSYAYNERGWLKKINDPASAPPSDNSKLFSMELKYNDGSNAQFNGNIANQVFVNTGTSTEATQTFSYQYDALNRLTSGISTGASVAANNMSENNITYDELGNIRTLTRDGNVYGYSYVPNGTVESSRLKSVSGLTTGDYQYDVNGNMTTDARNGTALQYNFLNLPTNVTKTGVNLNYVYDADGQKIRKVSNVTGTTDYIGGIVYNSISNVYRIDYIQTEEGRAVNNNDGTYRYQYDLKDQLGNIRLTLQKNSTTGKADRIQSDNYYAFGLRKSISPIPSSPNKYLYNGKELQEETGDYDYGARHYDPVITRWVAMDPMAEKYRRWTPYNYVMSNPIRFIDPDGMDAYTSKAEGADVDKIRRELEQWVRNAGRGADGLTNNEWIAANKFGNFGDEIINDVGAGIFMAPNNGNDTTKNSGRSKLSKNEESSDYYTRRIPGKGNTFRGGKKNDRDNDMKKYPDDFRKWYHNETNKKHYKLPNQPDPDLSEPYQDWLDLGKPKSFTIPHINAPKISPVAVGTGIGIGSIIASYWWLGILVL